MDYKNSVEKLDSNFLSFKSYSKHFKVVLLFIRVHPQMVTDTSTIYFSCDTIEIGQIIRMELKINKM